MMRNTRLIAVSADISERCTERLLLSVATACEEEGVGYRAILLQRTKSQMTGASMDTVWHRLIKQKAHMGHLGREEQLALRDAWCDEFDRRVSYRREKPIREFKAAVNEAFAPLLDFLAVLLTRVCGGSQK